MFHDSLKKCFTVYPRLKQTFHISHVRISQNVKDALMWNLPLIFSCEDEHIGRFSNLY